LFVNAPEGYPNAEIISIDYPEQVLVNNSFTVEITIDHWTGGDIEGLLVCIQDQDEYQDPVPFNAPRPKVRELRKFIPEGPDTDIFELEYRAPSYTDELSLVVEVYFFHRSTRSTTSDRPASHLEFRDSEIIEVDAVTSIQTPTPTPTTTPESTPTTEPTSTPSPTTTSTQPAETPPETAMPTEKPSDTSALLNNPTNAILILVLVLVIIVLVFALIKPKSKAKITKDKYCSKCEAPIQKGYDFCNKCGTKIKRD